ncbi:ATP-binding cassette sub- D member 3, partial [Coelomomyces lativittatus]
MATTFTSTPSSQRVLGISALMFIFCFTSMRHVVKRLNKSSHAVSSSSSSSTTFLTKALFEFGFMMWPLSMVNHSLKLCISSLALAFRTRLTQYAHNQYLKGFTFYRVANDPKMHNPDQLLTQDVDKFADALSHLYSDIAKPVVDIFLFSYKLGQAIGKKAPFYMIGYFVFSGYLLRALSPPFGKYTAMEQKLEADYRYAHSRILAHSEEIAFYQGGETEKHIVNKAYARILHHCQSVLQLRFANGILDSIFVKYLATMLAYFLLAKPIVFDDVPATPTPIPTTQRTGLLDPPKNNDATLFMETYSRNSGYLVHLSQAVGRLVLAGRDLTRLAGYTTRVAQLFQGLTPPPSTTSSSATFSSTSTPSSPWKPVSSSSLSSPTPTLPTTTTTPSSSSSISSSPSSPSSSSSSWIAFHHVTLQTPTGDTLVHDLTFQLSTGMHCFVTGPNGCGKSSLFRVLGGLWPCPVGQVQKPSSSFIFYVPQKPYLALGTLRDQVLYPTLRR